MGLQNKQLPLLLVLALAFGLALDRRLGAVARSPWLWAGAALAIALWLPNLLWQATHGWPQLELAGDIREDEAGANRVTLLPFQLLLVGPLLVPLLAAGLWALLRGNQLRRWRTLGFAYLSLLGIVLITGGKPYYVAPLLLCLLAAGAAAVEGWLSSSARAALLGVAILLTAASSMLLGLPLVPVEHLQATPVADINDDAIETVGWPAFVRTVADVYAGLSPAEQETAVVFAGNYGEAGAIDRFGGEYGLPPAYSGHNAYARFGMPPASAGPVLVLGYGDPSDDFRGCRAAATIDNGVEVENEEQDGEVFVCTAPRRPWADLWPALTHLDA